MTYPSEEQEEFVHHEVLVDFTSERILTVTVRAGDNPAHPGNWVGIVGEKEIDFYLEDVKKVYPASDPPKAKTGK